jgi:uncharacterized membrane protein YeaQ/YmgE (transglycosylase-associated protein family)
VGIDIITKIAFGSILLPIVYLIGFLLRDNADNVYKSLNLLLYAVGHLFNMLLLSIIGFISNDGKVCDEAHSLILVFGMLNPFTFNFFGGTLDHFICAEYSSRVHTLQLIYSLAQCTLGACIVVWVINLEERSFQQNFQIEEQKP